MHRHLLQLPAGPPITDPVKALAAVTKAVPQLGPHGMLRTDYGSFCLECIGTAMELLRRCRRVKTPRWSSYWLKHKAENRGRHNGGESYVANGDLIVAALALRIPATWDGTSPNIRIAVSGADAERLDPEMQAQLRRWRRE